MVGLIFFVGLVVFGLLIVAFGLVAKQSRAKLAAMTPEERAEVARNMQELAEAQEKAAQARIAAAGSRSRSARSLLMSPVAKTVDGELTCPRCGSKKFTVHRSAATRVGAVASGLVGAAARQDQVDCTACGSRYSRG
jgi:DNA-directed RNA polymerase subunit RPC12/RpoP